MSTTIRCVEALAESERLNLAGCSELLTTVQRDTTDLHKHEEIERENIIR